MNDDDDDQLMDFKMLAGDSFACVSHILRSIQNVNLFCDDYPNTGYKGRIMHVRTTYLLTFRERPNRTNQHTHTQTHQFIYSE